MVTRCCNGRDKFPLAPCPGPCTQAGAAKTPGIGANPGHARVRGNQAPDPADRRSLPARVSPALPGAAAHFGCGVSSRGARVFPFSARGWQRGISSPSLFPQEMASSHPGCTLALSCLVLLSQGKRSDGSGRCTWGISDCRFAWVGRRGTFEPRSHLSPVPGQGGTREARACKPSAVPQPTWETRREEKCPGREPGAGAGEPGGSTWKPSVV